MAIDALAPMRLERQRTVEQLVHEKDKQYRSVQRSESNVVPNVTIRESIDKKRHQSADNSVKQKIDTNITVKERLKKLQELSSTDSLDARKASISKLEEAVACIQKGERFSLIHRSEENVHPLVALNVLTTQALRVTQTIKSQ